MKAIVLSLALAVLAGGAQAQITRAQVLATYQEKGFTQIEVKSIGSTIKVEAVKGGTKFEVIYDTTTGTIVKQESHPAEDVSGGQGSDDGAGHDAGDDHGSGGQGADDGAGHDAGDDHGGDRNGADNSGSGRSGSGRDGSGRHGADD